MWNFNLALHFQNVCKKFGKNTALIFDDISISYNELNSHSDHITYFLIEKKLKQEDVVCISSIKNIDSYATVVACWKLGITYTFIDRFSPEERTDKILKTCQPKLVIGDKTFISGLKEHSKYTSATFTEISEKKYIKPPQNINYCNITSNTIAYIMFTSGSTGDPNGVSISHGNILNFFSWGENTYQIKNTDVFTGMNPLYFDNSVFDLYMTLLSGACMIPLSREYLKNPQQVIKTLQDKKVTIWFSVPSLLIYFLKFKAFESQSCSHIQKIIFGGEGFPKYMLKSLFNIFHDSTQLYNVYGPTECTCICSSYEISTVDFSDMSMNKLAPLGKIANNFKYYIFDKNNQIVRPGNIGELVLRGPNVGQGYYNNSKKTQSKFIQNPYNSKTIEIVYKTGDLVMLDTQDNLLHFCGRIDSQVKFMGYRIELGEIEASLAMIDGILESVVTFGKINNIDEITCFLVSNITKKEIKNTLHKRLPAYMIPRKFIYLDSIPKNPNGKIDKRSLGRSYYDEK